MTSKIRFYFISCRNTISKDAKLYLNEKLLYLDMTSVFTPADHMFAILVATGYIYFSITLLLQVISPV